MNTNHAAYWIALGVLALGLNSEYQRGSFGTLHRVAERVDSTLCRVATRAEKTLAVARLLTSHQELPSDDLVAATEDAEMARAQGELPPEQAIDRAEFIRDRVRDQVRDQVRNQIRAQADVIRAQAEMRRAELEQIRWRTRSQVRLVRTVNRRATLVCPKTGALVVVNAGPDLRDSPDF